MAAPIIVTDVEVLNNPASFFSPFSFKITFECLPPGVKDELEWKIIYVGSAKDEGYDQVLDSVCVGPVGLGINQFIFESQGGPDASKIPEEDLLEVTVVLLTCWYRNYEFIRVGYYVNNEIDGEPAIGASHNDLSRVTRNILTQEPRVTRYHIPWDSTAEQVLSQELSGIQHALEENQQEQKDDEIDMDEGMPMEDDDEYDDEEDDDDNVEIDIEDEVPSNNILDILRDIRAGNATNDALKPILVDAIQKHPELGPPINEIIAKNLPQEEALDSLYSLFSQYYK